MGTSVAPAFVPHRPFLAELLREAPAVEVALEAAAVRRLLVAERHHRRHSPFRRRRGVPDPRGLHSSTFQLNLSRV